MKAWTPNALYDAKPWVFIIVGGILAVGMIPGRTVTEHGREMWTFSPAPVPGGVAIMVTRAPQ